MTALSPMLNDIFVGTGTWLVFLVILVPVYVMIAAWFVGKPGDIRQSLLGVGYIVGITAAIWLGLFVVSVIVGVLFYELPGTQNIGHGWP
ncbi:hypothetical protein K0C01_08925 [Salinarchaeum sp. IM2453]|uniref:hypothetical protein n=1 Tax=Salinarchaeum sp. IM2453 TaxID=2862870 RepID=UPI001C82A7E6|nr:hypothetical protein [Salinarchaeum sp. IM2453]QZA87918.1 hypothetical protein K0C01_08925 [Salinarchaeum sp. IM2453]